MITVVHKKLLYTLENCSQIDFKSPPKKKNPTKPKQTKFVSYFIGYLT